MDAKDKLGRLQYPASKYLVAGPFEFIGNKTLRGNIAINTQYVASLATLEQEYEVGQVSYSIFKDIIVQSASIVESLINYTLRSLLRMGKIKINDVLNDSFNDTGERILHRCGKNTYLIEVKRKKDKKEINGETHFVDLNRAAKRCRLIDDDLFERCEKLRKQRNRIHLAGLAGVDKNYSKNDLDEVFKTVGSVINKVEKSLS
jgi:hypothetical protein